MAGYGVCDAGAQLSSSIEQTERFCCSQEVCDTPVLTKKKISELFVFSQLLGDNYEGRWLRKGTIFEIDILNATGSTAAEAAGPPYIGGFVVWTTTANGRYLRDADGKSEPCEMMSPVLEGSFGPELIKVMSMRASDPDDGDPAYDVGDAITIQFSEKTNKGELPDRKVSRADIDKLLKFNMPLGEVYISIYVIYMYMYMYILYVYIYIIYISYIYIGLSRRLARLRHAQDHYAQRLRLSSSCARHFKRVRPARREASKLASSCCA
jgi:hypothetical protein